MNKKDSLDEEIENQLRGKCSVCGCGFRDGAVVLGVVLFNGYGRHISVDVDKLRCVNCVYVTPEIVHALD